MGRKYGNWEMRQIIRGSLTPSNTNLLAINLQTTRLQMNQKSVLRLITVRLKMRQGQNFKPATDLKDKVMIVSINTVSYSFLV